MRTFFLTLALAASSLASGATIYSNGGPENLDSADARGMTIFRVADDFTLAGSYDVDTIRFWMLAEPGVFGGTITYAFYNDSAGSLGGLIGSNTVTSITPTLLNPVTGFIYSMYLVEFSLPSALNLGAGTYWLELHNGPDLVSGPGVNVYWSLANTTSGNAKQNGIPTLPADGVNNELAFELDGSPAGVPEPATYSLVLGAFGVLALLKRRRSR